MPRPCVRPSAWAVWLSSQRRASSRIRADRAGWPRSFDEYYGQWCATEMDYWARDNFSEIMKRLDERNA